MILSENRYPLFRIMLTPAAAPRAALRRRRGPSPGGGGGAAGGVAPAAGTEPRRAAAAAETALSPNVAFAISPMPASEDSMPVASSGSMITFLFGEFSGAHK